MKRYLPAAICLVIAGLCLASIIGWARSYVSAEAISASRRFQRYAVISNDGCLALTYGRLVFETPDAEQAWRSGIDPAANVDRWSFVILHELNQIPSAEKQFLGFGAQSWDFPMTRRGTISGVTLVRSLVQFPFWFATLLSGAWPAAWLWKLSRLRRSRVQLGLCRKCGFDLAGIYYSCPKCGQRIPLRGFEAASLPRQLVGATLDFGELSRAVSPSSTARNTKGEVSLAPTAPQHS